ncbi:helix-turn-helix transcriptional regulator [Arthrobacter cryoconiti]|uniref:Helix-turn-helix transcriptional regulator n=1 Tax=Arthrobacter cryoconiti TaxID=748907 RepID=A0ABV8R3E8_9MICC|nr:helix-turn-helix transcriptional regulator [Arthrobacter cryoconiti]MCC9067155.1 helix-turn-helix transcriptional regulator [Arthrobacter cryoconiti]
MNNRNEIREFLASRRAKLTPQQVGLPTFGGIRRVPGLRRGEVSQLAGVSVEYYTRLERGSLAGVSDSVLDSIARALRLTEAEHQHLFNLAKAASSAPRTRRRAAKEIDPSIQQILDGMVGIPAFVQNRSLDIVAANDLGRALYSEAFKEPAHRLNYARFVFFNRGSESLYADWNLAADTVVAMLHAEAGRDPFDRCLTDLVGELSTRSTEFRRRWAQHDVRHHRSGVKTLRHPSVGDLVLHFNALELSASPGLTMFAYTAEPGSSSEDGLALLASWAATTKELVAEPASDAHSTTGDALRH